MNINEEQKLNKSRKQYFNRQTKHFRLVLKINMVYIFTVRFECLYTCVLTIKINQGSIELLITCNFQQLRFSPSLVGELDDLFLVLADIRCLLRTNATFS